MADAEQHTSGSSKRFLSFVNAFEHTTQNATTRWTFEDVSACFPSYCADAPEQAAQLRADVGRMMAAEIMKLSQRYLDSYDAGAAIDALHEAAATAKAHEASGSAPPRDAWRPRLDPRVVVRARLAPLLERERVRMADVLRELEEENAELAAQLDANTAAKVEADEDVTRMLDGLDRATQKWTALPAADIEAWTIDALENQPIHASWNDLRSESRAEGSSQVRA